MEGAKLAKELTAQVDIALIAETGAFAARKKAEKLNSQEGAKIAILDEAALRPLFALSRDEAHALLCGGKSTRLRLVKRWEMSGKPPLDFTGCDFRGVKFYDATYRADGLFCDRVCDFRGADFREARFSESTSFTCPIQGARFDGATLKQAAFGKDGASFEGCSFVGAEMPSAELHGAKSCDFRRANLEEAEFHGDIEECSFASADLSQARGGDYRGPPPVHFTNCDFTESRMASAKFFEAVFEDCDLQKADLAGAVLAGALLGRVDLRGANLRGANLAEAELGEVLLDGADLTGANIKGWKLTRTKIKGVKGIGADEARLRGSIGSAVGAFVSAAKQFEMGRVEVPVVVGDDLVDLAIFWYPQHSVAYGPGEHCNIEFARQSIEEVLIGSAARWPGDIRLLKMEVNAKGANRKQKLELLELARAAWCEAFGQELPDEASRSKTAATKLDEYLGWLRGGPAGIKKWNARRGKSETPEKHWEVTDFSGADLSGIDARGVFLLAMKWRRTNWSKADLRKAKLERGDFTGADFRESQLGEIIGWNAQFERADFTGANLAKADIRDAKLPGAKLIDANLREAILDCCNLRGTDFTGADLRKGRFHHAAFNEATIWPKGFAIPDDALWHGRGRDPRLGVASATAPPPAGSLELKGLIMQLDRAGFWAKRSKALSMLKKGRCQLYSVIEDAEVAGVVRSQAEKERVYACRLRSDGAFCCCTSNLRPCSGMQGSVCKHLLALIVGLVKKDQLDAALAHHWVVASQSHSASLDKEAMSELFLKYQGAEAGEIDWRPTETLPEE